MTTPAQNKFWHNYIMDRVARESSRWVTFLWRKRWDVRRGDVDE